MKDLYAFAKKKKQTVKWNIGFKSDFFFHCYSLKLSEECHTLQVFVYCAHAGILGIYMYCMTMHVIKIPQHIGYCRVLLILLRRLEFKLMLIKFVQQQSTFCGIQVVTDLADCNFKTLQTQRLILFLPSPDFLSLAKKIKYPWTKSKASRAMKHYMAQNFQKKKKKKKKKKKNIHHPTKWLLKVAGCHPYWPA